MSNTKTADNAFPSKKRIAPSDDNDNIWNRDDAKEPDDIEEEEQMPAQYVYVLPCHLIDMWIGMKKRLIAISNGECSLKEIATQIQEICYLHFAEKRRVDVENLVVFFDELSPQKSQYFLKELFPFMARTALEIEHAFTEHPILLLISEEENSQVFTKLQIAILLCNMFFCTLHQQQCSQQFPKIFDCSLLFMQGKNPKVNAMKRQKLWFLFEYFTTLQNDQLNLDLHVSFERVYGPNLQEDIRSAQLKDDCEDSLAQVKIHSKQKIEENQNGVQVVFANKLVGGGVLGNGSIQEEIRYLISPECLVSVLLFEELQDLEALVIKGAQQISKYSGYSNSLQFEGPYDGKEPQIDVVNNMYQVTIVGIDALNYNKKIQEDEDDYIFPELSLESLMREIRKAYAGFASTSSYPARGPRRNTVSTGNWGCGDYGGDKEIKFFIQWIAASLAKVKILNYHTYNDAIQEADIREITNILGNSEVRDVYSMVREYILDRKSNGKKNYEKLSLFQYIATFYN